MHFEVPPALTGADEGIATFSLVASGPLSLPEMIYSDRDAQVEQTCLW